MYSYSSKDLIGHKIINIRPMTLKEAGVEGWGYRHRATPVIELDNGLVLYPSRDEEGNGPGVIFGWSGDDHFMVSY